MAIYSWLNPLFLWPFSIAFCMFTRRYLQMARYFHREHDDQLATRSPGEFCILLQPLDIWDSSPQNTSEFPGLGDFTLACLSSVHFNYPWANQYRYDMRFGKNAFTLLPYEFSIFFQVVLCSVNSLGTFGSRARASQSALASQWR